MKKPIYKKWWFWVLLVVILAGIGGAMAGESDIPVNNDVVIEQATQAKPEDNEDNEDNVVPSINDDIVYVGESATTNGYTLTVQSAGVFISDNEFLQPEDGKEYVTVDVLIENTGKEDITVSSLLCFNAYVDDFSVDLDIMNDAGEILDGTVAVGKKLQGMLCYQLPIGWETLEINVDIDFFSNSDNMKIVVENTAN